MLIRAIVLVIKGKSSQWADLYGERTCIDHKKMIKLQTRDLVNFRLGASTELMSVLSSFVPGTIFLL